MGTKQPGRSDSWNSSRGNAFNEDVSKAYLAGMDEYITKPVSLQEIKKVLQSIKEKEQQPEA